MIYKKEECAGCGYIRPIINRKHTMCAVCNRERLHGTSFSPGQPIKRTPLKKTRKKTGELGVFKMIWSQRDHRSEISGRDLNQFANTDFFVNMFAHVLDKKNYPRFRNNPDNIMLLHPEEHNLLDQGTEKQRRAYEKKWRMSFQSFYDKQREMKNLYKNI